MKKAVMYGAGNIGRGFIGQLFSASGYRVVFVDIVKETVKRLNDDGCYPIKIARRDGYEEVIVDNVEAVSGLDENAVINHIADADIMATAVGVNILPKVAPLISKGITKRYENGKNKPLNIIICENLLDAHLYLKKLLKENIKEDIHSWLEKNVGLVEASIGRMVPVMTPKMKGDNPLRVYVEEYDILPVDQKGFKGEIPAVKNMVPYQPFDFYIQRKLYMHNMAHATTAYLGKYKDYEYVWEACKDTIIKNFAIRSLTESAVAMSKQHKEDINALVNHGEDLIYRFQNPSLGDTVNRVGRDTKRKLSPDDRMAGTVKLCKKNGVFPVYVCVGLAAGFMFNAKGDKMSEQIVNFVKQKGIDDAITEVCDISKDSDIHAVIKDFYNMLKSGTKLEIIMEKAEIMKNKYIKRQKQYI